MLFSKRNKIIPLKKDIQIESVDEELRIRLWNVLKVFYWDNFVSYSGYSSVRQSNFEDYILKLWHNFFKYSLDDQPLTFNDSLKIIKKNYFSYQWYQIFDFIEFTIANSPNIKNIVKFPTVCNVVLEEENSAYRIVEGNFTRITDEIEISEIEESISNSDKYYGVKTHLKTALIFISERKQPDYRNSIKESISAVESICQIITNDKKATLGSAIKKIDEKYNLHPALKSAFSSLYGFTSDKDGIRHALLDKSNITFNDAKYMLVTCSSFINYLLVLLAENGNE
jgi:hypothetical protein